MVFPKISESCMLSLASSASSAFSNSMNASPLFFSVLHQYIQSVRIIFKFVLSHSPSKYFYYFRAFRISTHFHFSLHCALQFSLTSPYLTQHLEKQINTFHPNNQSS
eukprot:TRINITY_DN439_c1_g2_i1.p1 TRINITY_DN439_c1_g2~~TRINITY_DN439_c1_g2_i1.p1  ORF type:complete len:107 (-),score=10.78 TRINITY_DN439_c1_g2_i1:94-414(-)